jgi:hypothetical protein
MIVVYKIDRLTRSLADFPKLVERMEAAGCSFVSVTQSFNTSSSMGRLTLNMLLSFAQFEREVTAERIRDKIAASKKKGLWMGGLAPLGYDPHPDKTRRELVVNEAEAETVQKLFQMYLSEGCLNATMQAASKAGLRSKFRTFASGRTQSGAAFGRGMLYTLLTNPAYRGRIRHKDKTWPAVHPAIIDEDLWDAVQAKLQAASAKRRGVKKINQGVSEAPLLGKLRDDAGERLTPTHTKRHNRIFRYYVSNGYVTGKPRPDGWRLPAKQLEDVVAQSVANQLMQHGKYLTVLHTGSADQMRAAGQSATSLAKRFQQKGIAYAAAVIDHGTISKGQLVIELARDVLAELLGCAGGDLAPTMLTVSTTFTLRRRGMGTKIVAGDQMSDPDQTLIRALQNAHRWADDLKSGKPVKRIAADHDCSDSYVRRVVPLATLSPDLQQAILGGTQHKDLTLEKLIRANIPLDWAAQEKQFGNAI